MKNAHWLLACALLLTGCFLPAGAGPTGILRKEEAKPVIAALENYYKAQQSYPTDLKALVPDYLENTPKHISYSREGASYNLIFEYASSYMNMCTYTPLAGKWNCIGYY
ncbi:MAG: hypothetical protein ACAH80_10480 [Alphaproteobacteria bacterium]